MKLEEGDIVETKSTGNKAEVMWWMDRREEPEARVLVRYLNTGRTGAMRATRLQKVRTA